ncbi:MAG: aldo/keto reductase [Clostridia bacterium]|nr:aldo/keto reductase [Clostridia bacterium]
MKRTEKQGLSISAMTLGTVQLGLNYGINNKNGMPTETESFRILDTAYEHGVTMLDTSNDYGESEAVIGKYLRANPEKRMAICTKFRIDKESGKDVYGSLRAFATASMKKLGVDHLPIFMSHIEDDYFNYGKELAVALDELKKEGLIHSAGMSVSKKDRLEEIVDSGIFDAIQLPLNIWDNEVIRNGTVKSMADAGIAVFVRSVYLQGMFFRSEEEVRNTKFASAAPLIQALHAIAEDEGITVPELALSFIRDTEGVTSLVVGSETPEQVRQNAAMFESPSLSARTMERILSEFSNVDPFLISPWLWSSRQ